MDKIEDTDRICVPRPDGAPKVCGFNRADNGGPGTHGFVGDLPLALNDGPNVLLKVSP